jgi:CO dehydrogenase/acetyl-CoA synthase gamma subunit (corrinoid Fe-S protein)
MQITIELPDDIAIRLTQRAGNLPQKALESLALESYRAELLSHGEVERMLNLSSEEVEALIKSANAHLRYTTDELVQDRETCNGLEKLPTVAETFNEIRKICLEEDFELEIPLRQDRPNPLMADDVSF